MRERKSALEDLRKEFRKKTRGGLPETMQEVTVAAPDEESLEEGLELAQEVISEGPESLLRDLEDESVELEPVDEEVMVVSPEEEAEEIMEKLTPEVAKALIEKLTGSL